MELRCGTPSSFNHLVSAGQERVRNVDGERLGRPKIDGHFKLGCPRDRHFGRVGTVEDLANIGACLTISTCNARTVTDQAAILDVVAQIITRRDGMARCQRDKRLPLACEERTAVDQDCTGTCLNNPGEGGLKVALALWTTGAGSAPTDRSWWRSLPERRRQSWRWRR